MRIFVVLGLAACGISWSGCAAPTQAGAPNVVTAPPSTAELPQMALDEDVLPAKIGIETHNQPPRHQYVVVPPPPQLTPEEEKALGIKKPQFDPLELYSPAPGLETPVWPYTSTIESPAFGLGGSGARPFSIPYASTSAIGPASVAVPWGGPARSVTGLYLPSQPAAAGFGPRGGTQIGEGRPTHTGSRFDRSRP